MTGAMYAAVSGLRAHMTALNIIGHNISNINTLGYKATRYTFNEALYTSSRSGSDGTDQVGGRNPAQIGYGCSIGTIDLDMSTKNYTPTGMPLDTMIDGDGFFIVGDKTKLGVTTQDMLQGMNLTRLGNFSFDANGYLVDGNGSVVYGFLRMASAEEVWLAGAEEDPETGELVNPDYNTPDDVPETKLTCPVLTPIRYPMCAMGTDSVGNSRTLIAWPTFPTDEETGEKDRTQVVDATDFSTIANDEDDEDGIVISDTVPLARLQPDTVSIDEKSGAITCVTKDGLMVTVGYLALGKVDNPNGVTHVDGRYFQASGGAGSVHLTSVGGVIQYVPGARNAQNQPIVWDFAPGEDSEDTILTVETAGGTKLVSGGLESSGTDLATEISNMVIIQRGYQANTRIVSVTDSMLEELANMKR